VLAQIQGYKMEGLMAQLLQDKAGKPAVLLQVTQQPVVKVAQVLLY
jgi:hypothetical protein